MKGHKVPNKHLVAIGYGIAAYAYGNYAAGGVRVKVTADGSQTEINSMGAGGLCVVKTLHECSHTLENQVDNESDY